MFAKLKQKWANGPKISSLRGCAGGVAAVEFAFIFPMFLGLMTGGVELTWYANTRMKLTQLALHVADHSSRMGSSGALQNLPVFEADVNDVMAGTMLQGESINLQEQGRIIISSLQLNASGGQWIAWQRCMGNPAYPSTHGLQDAGKTGTSFPGMGYASKRVQARSGEAVMFSEIRYKYEPIFGIFDGISEDDIISEIAAFNVRDDRDLSQIYNSPGEPKRTC